MTSTGCLSERKPVVAEVIMENCCHAPGASGVTFAAFNPCSGADYGSTYTLTDTRDGKQYTVKYMPDGRYWMVQDLAFGERCETTTSMGDRTTVGNITANGIYYGDCYKVNFAGAGYAYNITAAMNYGVTTSGYTCSGTLTGYENNRPATCGGICPERWHLPTSNEWADMVTAFRASPLCVGSRCWLQGIPLTLCDPMAGQDNNTQYATSTSQRYYFYLAADGYTATGLETSMFVRCAMNVP
jgi:uncharacterized protein (TIGR02145 family)